MRNLKLVAIAAALLGLGALAQAAKEAKKDVVWPSDAIKWEKGPAEGTRVAKLWGEMDKGAYGVLIKFDDGLLHPLHSHTQDLKIVVISGTFVHTPEGGTETKLGPGSYLLQRGGAKHVSGCAKGSECEFMMISGGKFDMTMAAKGEMKGHNH